MSERQQTCGVVMTKEQWNYFCDFKDDLKRKIDEWSSATPELTKLQKKYSQKEQTQENMMKQNQEMMAIYQKYKINPMAGCLFALIQLPIFIAFFDNHHN